MAEVIEIAYKPRPQQLAIHEAVDNHRFTVVVAHRRMGKTVSAINHLIKAAIECSKPNPRFAYIAPTYAQSKRVAWDYLLEFTRPLGAVANISELRVDFWGRRISLYGSDNADSLRGQYFDGVILDEIGDQNPKIWNEVIRPALADRNTEESPTWCLFIGTPKGRNHFADFRDRAKTAEGWTLLEFKAHETKIIDQKELDAARKEMGDDKYNQEFECSFDAAVEGSYYGQIINDLEAKNRITTIERDDLCKSYVAWDLGISDSTSLWVAQVVGKEVRLIDFTENHGVGLDWYVRWLKDNGYEGFTQFLPHDVEVRELGTGKSRKEVLQEAGLDITVAPRLSIADGIQAVRRLLPQCWFDHKTKAGLDALRNYRREYNERQQVFYDKPNHDWCFTGDTNVLTRYGTYQIMELPKSGEVLTSCGWKQYINPRITRKNASLVEVEFKGGYSVRCTPDHLFKTVNGWKSAESLTRGLQIQSTLTRLHSILMVGCTAFTLANHIYQGAVKNFIGMFGLLHLEKFPKIATYITKMVTLLTMPLKTWSAYNQPSIYKKQCLTGIAMGVEVNLQTKQEEKQQNGISLKKEDCGINVTQSGQKDGLSGNESQRIAQYAINYLMHLSAKVATHKYIAPLIAKQLVIEHVKHLDYLEDVWCITIDDVEEFSLSNGALVHNCSHASDAFRYLAISLDQDETSWQSDLPINTKWIV